MKLRQIMLRVYNIEKSLEFYKTVLGLNVIRQEQLKEANLYYMAADESDTLLVLCYNYNHPEKYTHGSHFGFIGFQINSMEKFSKKIESLGTEFYRTPFNTDDGRILAFMKDPDGHCIEIYEVKK